jgi:hypothetical protein
VADIVRLTLRAERQDVPAIVRLRRLLKALLRGYGFRCVRIEEMVTDADTAARQEALPARGATVAHQVVPRSLA